MFEENQRNIYLALQELYVGNNAQNCYDYAEEDIIENLVLTHSNMVSLTHLEFLTSLELENVTRENVLELLKLKGERRKFHPNFTKCHLFRSSTGENHVDQHHC